MKKFPKLEATRAYNPDGTRMQCKHIPDIRILEFLYDHQDAKVIDWRNEYDPTSIHFQTVTKVEAFSSVVTVGYDITVDGLSLKKGEGILVKFTNDVKHSGDTLTVAGLFPPNVPQKLIRAKMNKLQNRGLIAGGDGSPSGNHSRVGSRFDAQITEKGRKYVESITHCDLF
jgi:hypothetical protein